LNCVSLVILNWNGRHFLSECLEGLRDQRYRSFEIIVVDNGSDDGSVDFITRCYPEASVISLSRNLGFAAANNLAIKTVKSKYVALLNNDAVPGHLWLEKLIDAMERHPEAGFAASKMVFEKDRETIDRAGDAYTTAGAALLRGRGESVDNFDNEEWVFGACAGASLYRTEMLRDIGLFDEDFFLLYEDVDLSFRAQLKGYKCLYIPEALVYHKGSSSIVHDSSLSVYYGHRNLEWVYVQNMPSRLLLRTIFLHIFYDIAALSYFVISGRGKDFFRAKKDALRGLKRALIKRQRIQSGKVVGDGYLWSLFERPRLMERLSGRSLNPFGSWR
jgi:GT2 family glycosyltransferase